MATFLQKSKSEPYIYAAHDKEELLSMTGISKEVEKSDRRSGARKFFWLEQPEEVGDDAEETRKRFKGKCGDLVRRFLFGCRRKLGPTFSPRR